MSGPVSLFLKSPKGIAISSVLGLGAIIYGNGSETIINDAEHCINKDAGFWIDAQGGTLFLNPVLKCDK